MKTSKNLNALIYLFDDIISEKLGYSMEEYVQVIDSLDDDEAEFIMNATFEIIVCEEEGEISDEVANQFLSAKDRFDTFYESFFKKSVK